MRPEQALLNYQGRVVREKQRIADFISAASEEVRASWAKTRTTRRFALTLTDSIAAWKSDGSKSYCIHAIGAEFAGEAGVVARIKLADVDTSVVDRTVTVGRYPHMLESGLFIQVDGVEPFVQDAAGQTYICVLLYSTAAPKGDWPEGWVAGTTKEFNEYRQVMA